MLLLITQVEGCSYNDSKGCLEIISNSWVLVIVIMMAGAIAPMTSVLMTVLIHLRKFFYFIMFCGIQNSIKATFLLNIFKIFVTMCNVALSSVAGTTCLGCCLLLSCAEVDCKKAQFFWLFKVRAQSSPSVQSARLRQCVPPHTRATVASAWISILSRIGANIFGFCGLSYIQGVGKC